ncbi:MAG: diaminopimelate epimerase [Alphaproteobacteria bacterium]|nr:diaminopimelate epimerase [Alphaproteobacteria bacterium]
MHGLGNDFLILDHRKNAETLGIEQIRRLCDRHLGVGCDQLVVMENTDKADIRAIFYNADGSTSGACGNASRCVADIYMKEQNVRVCTLETQSGTLTARAAENGMITVDMGPPGLDWRAIPLAEERDTLDLGLSEGAVSAPVGVSMGNPHCVFFVDDLGDIPVDTLGAHFEHDPLFPQRANVEFVEVLSPVKLRQKTWERGAGLTLACGSGACAAAVAGVRRGLTGRKVEIVLDGGSLFIEWRESDGHVLMTGPVAYVFEGKIKGEV